MTTIIVTLITGVIGSSAMTAFVQWLIRRYDEHHGKGLERVIATSPTIRRLELEIYRQTLFLPTSNRVQHEHQLEVGKTYIDLGGNGVGHARYEQLEADYRRRLDTDDWTYGEQPYNT